MELTNTLSNTTNPIIAPMKYPAHLNEVCSFNFLIQSLILFFEHDTSSFYSF